MTVNEESVFAAAMDRQSPHERAVFLDHACAGNPGLRQGVESLLSAYDAGQFLEAPAPGLNATMGLIPAVECPGADIGPYKLLEQIGEGGMGLVFMADQLRPVRRRVALKIIKPGMDSQQVIARFEAERQALAMMDHPNIAKIFDAGTTDESEPRTQRSESESEPRTQRSGVSGDGADDGPLTPLRCVRGSGRPYFAMELVRGIPITDYSDEHKLAIRQRLELFVQVCQAVQHAHQKGVIHRDLKPSNVLVAHDDTVPLPKIIDFGIAKATSQPLTERTLFTALAQVVGTPLYMSPEQAALNHLDVDTRSDVYSLGVLLYELLTGTTPFEQERLRQAGLDEVRRIIREEEPPRPSTRVSTLGAGLTTVSQRRSVDPRRISVALSGDLDWIVMKSLEKDRQRRYESASALAADVGRYLKNEAVEACPPSAAYRLRKFSRRNRRVLVPTGVIAVALVAATAISTWQAALARDAQRQAETDRKQAEADRDLAKVAQQQAEGDREWATAAERKAATDAAIATAVNNFLQVDLLRQVNNAPLADEAAFGSANLTVREALGRAAANIGDRFQDQPLVEAAIRLAIGEAYHSVGEDQLAVPHLERAVELRAAQLASDHQDTIDSMFSLALAYEWAGRVPDAIELHKRIMENEAAILGPDHTETLARMSSLAIAYRKAGQWDTSVPLLEWLLEKRRASHGPTHRETLGTMHVLGMNYGDVGRLEESICLQEQVLKTSKATLGPDHEATLYVMNTCALAYQRVGKFDQADDLLREALVHRRKRTDSFGQIRTARVLNLIGLNLLLQQQYVESEPLLSEGLSIYEKEKPEDWECFHLMSALGGSLFGQQKYAAAEPLLLQGYEGLKQRESIILAPSRHRVTESGERIVSFYGATNQPEKARMWREKLASGKRSEK